MDGGLGRASIGLDGCGYGTGLDGLLPRPGTGLLAGTGLLLAGLVFAIGLVEAETGLL